MSDTRRLLSPCAATLLRAADYIEEHGWCQVDFYRLDGRVCALGAIDMATGNLEDRRAARGRLLAHLGECSVINWNDERGRTEADVVMALRSAALTPDQTP